MKSRFDKSTGIWIVRLDKGDNIAESIQEFVQNKKIFGGIFSAIGALQNPILAYYNHNTFKYESREYSGIFEVTMQGNITLKDGSPFLHAHPVISGPDLAASMGHLMSATVGVTLECFITPFAEPLEREICAAIGLQHWKL